MKKAQAKALALFSDRAVTAAEEELYEVGFRGGNESSPEDYETTLQRVGNQVLPIIRSTNDDREVLGNIAKQLVIAGISFRLVSVR